MWSAMRRMRTPSGWSRSYLTPEASATAATIGRKMSVSKTVDTPWRQAAVRSRPMPVSMFFLGRGSSWPGPTRLNWVKTRFQISTSLGPAAVVEDLGARAADAVGAVGRCAGGPEIVVLAHAGDPVGGNLDLVVPDVVRLVVVEIDGDRQPVGGDLEHAAEELPGPVDRLALEVVAEAEIAQHLEEGLVERRLADVLDVAGAEALLAGGRPREARGRPGP